MAPARPTVSIGVPVYDGQDYLADALTSILGQSRDDFELLISDNASTDDTEEICRSFGREDERVRYFRQPANAGAARNYNLLVDLARGRFFKWAAHDDILAPTYLEHVVPRLESDNDVVVAFSAIDYIDETGGLVRRCSDDLSILASQPGDRVRAFFDHVGASDDLFWSVFGVIRLAALRRTGRIKPYVASDQALMFHLAMLGKFSMVDEPLFRRREHPDASMVKHQSARDRAAWFDSKQDQQLVMPNWQLLRDHLQIVWASGLPASTRTSVTRAVLRRFAGKWRHLGGEIRRLRTG